jgi:hypothetical protein
MFLRNGIYLQVHTALQLRHIHPQTKKITPWTTILPEKLTVTQLVKESPRFLWNPKVHRSSPLNTILSHFNPVHTLTSYLFKIHFNIICLLRLDFPGVSSFQVFRLKCMPFSSPHTCYMYRPPHSP